ncbi:hypothetical protein CU026_2323 [Enterococcus faecium]|nr:hypothetical protein [Enterococcus faecium]MBK4815511.1 hypothetical protein [Enterococcus faecium]
MIEELAEEHHLFGKRGCDTIFVTFLFFLKIMKLENFQ